MATSTLKIFMTEDAYVALQDEFADKKENELFRFVFEEVKKLARAAKMTQLTGVVACRVFDKTTLQLKEERLNLADHALPTVPSDPSWVPENLKKQKIMPLEIKLGSKTTENLKVFAQIYQLRVQRYNESIPKEHPDRNSMLGIPAKCVEEIYHNTLIDNILKKVEDNVVSDFDAEFSEIYKDEESKPRPPAQSP